MMLGPTGMAREIVIVLVVKTIALVVIWNVWFAGPNRGGAPANLVAEHLYPATAPAAPQAGPHARP